MQIQQLIGGLAVLAAVLLPTTRCVAEDAMPANVAQALRLAGVPAGNVAVVVQELGSARPSLSVNAGTPMNPASTMKLVTTYAGLELLGPAYRWRTESYLGGALRDGVLEGDLILKGGGDPKLTLEAFWMLLRNMRQQGLREIRGDLILDRSYFDVGEYNPARFDGEWLRPYNVGADALLINFKSIRFRFSGEPRGAARVSAEPPLLEIASTLRLGDGACGDWRERLKAEFQPHLPAPRAIFGGVYDASCGERDWNVALLAPNEYAASLFRLLWAELGGKLSGSVRDGTLAVARNAAAKPFASVESPTLAEVVRDINKFSNNVMARQLYLTIAADQAGAPAKADNAQRAIKAWLAKKGLDFPELVIENGSGLSRIERISAQNLNALLVAAFRSPVMPELAASLPLIAVDGTMRRRMKAESVAGQAHIKSGSLHDVRAISGYVLDRNGRRHAVTMIVNHPNAQQTQAAQDALLTWVYSKGS